MSESPDATRDIYRRITVFFKNHPYTRFNRLALMNAFDLQHAADLNRILDMLVSEGAIQISNAGTVCSFFKNVASDSEVPF